MRQLFSDTRVVARMLGRRPLLAAAAILSLAAGIGLSATIFGVLEAAVLRPLPVRDPGTLRQLLEQRDGDIEANFSHSGFVDYRRTQSSFTSVVAYAPVQVAVQADGGTTEMLGELVSGDFFSALSPGIRLGRGLSEVDRSAGSRAVILSDLAWRELFGASNDIEGRTVRLNGEVFDVVGVTERQFRGMQVGRDARFWALLAWQPILGPIQGQELVGSEARTRWLTVLGRLSPDATDATLSSELEVVGHVLARPDPDVASSVFAAPGSHGDSRVADLVASPLRLLLGGALLVLVIACANVGALILSRAAERSRELAVRRALGATGTQLARFPLIEAGLLGGAGALVGVTFTYVALPTALGLLSDLNSDLALDVGVNITVLAFTAGVGLAAAGLSAAVPTVRFARGAQPGDLVRGERGASPSRSAVGWRTALVAGQFGLAFALVAVSLLFVRTLTNLQTQPTGLDLDRVALISVKPEQAGYDINGYREYFRNAVDALSQVPGVERAAYGRVIPLGSGGSRMDVEIPEYEVADGEDMELNFNIVGPGYFEVLGIDVVQGRPIDTQDVSGQPLAVVVNESFAQRFWQGRQAVGRTVRIAQRDFLVVGVARDVKYRALREESLPTYYLSASQIAIPSGGVLHVRTAGDPADLLGVLREVLTGADPAVPTAEPRILADQAALNVSGDRASMLLGLVLSQAAILLAAVGVFGMATNLVRIRRREFAVRLALGATPRRIAWIVLSQAGWLAVAGAAVGTAIAAGVGRLLEGMLYGVAPLDPASLLGAFGILTGLSLASSWLPAKRAASLDPSVSLQAD